MRNEKFSFRAIIFLFLIKTPYHLISSFLISIPHFFSFLIPHLEGMSSSVFFSNVQKGSTVLISARSVVV